MPISYPYKSLDLKGEILARLIDGVFGIRDPIDLLGRPDLNKKAALHQIIQEFNDILPIESPGMGKDSLWQEWDGLRKKCGAKLYDRENVTVLGAFLYKVAQWLDNERKVKWDELDEKQREMENQGIWQPTETQDALTIETCTTSNEEHLLNKLRKVADDLKLETEALKRKTSAGEAEQSGAQGDEQNDTLGGEYIAYEPSTEELAGLGVFQFLER